MSGTYAATTSVPADRSIAEVRGLLAKHGATHYMYGSGPDGDAVQFQLSERHYRFNVERPTAAALRAQFMAENARDYRVTTRANAINWQGRTEQEWRRRWRARLLWLKALLEFVDDVPLEQSMLANLVLPDGNTFGNWAGPQVEKMYEGGAMPPLLGTGK